MTEIPDGQNSPQQELPEQAVPEKSYRQPPPMDPFLVDIFQAGLICGVTAAILLIFNYFDDPRGGKIDFVTGVGFSMVSCFFGAIMMYFRGIMRGRRFIDSGRLVKRTGKKSRKR